MSASAPVSTPVSTPGLAPTGLAVPGYVVDAREPRRLERAWQDIRDGFGHWRLPLALAKLDIRNRYRGSVLGPLWLTLSTAIMIVALGLLYSTLFRIPLADYLPFLAVSLIVWNVIAQIVTDACTSLISAEGIIRQMPLPCTVHALRCVFRNLLMAAHSLPLFILVFLAVGHIPGPTVVLALPGLALIAVNAFALAGVLGMISARFRDIPPIVANVMQLAFFMSPVIWKPELLGKYAGFLVLNPFYVLMETVRGPLLQGSPGPGIWAAAIIFTLLSCGVSFALFARFRGRIAFWV